LLAAPSTDQIRATARPLIRAARKRGIGVVFGVDGPQSGWLAAWTPGRPSSAIWSDRERQPHVLRLGGYAVAVLSEGQADRAHLCAAAAGARPELVVICARRSVSGPWGKLDWFRVLDVPVVPSGFTKEKCDIPPLVCPRGYRCPNFSMLKGAFSFSMFRIDELDGSLHAA
jgi:hypothetical protein